MQVSCEPDNSLTQELMPWRRMLFVGVCLCSTVGCLTGPDFRGVGAERIGTSYRNPQYSDEHANFDGSVPVENWWENFSDPILSQIVLHALSRNLSLEEQFERIVESRANYRLQTGQLAPNGDFATSYEYLKRSQNARPFVGQNGIPFNLLNVGFGATWEIDLFGRIQRTIEAAGADVQQREFDAANLRRILVGDIATSYVRVRLHQSQIQLALQNLESQSQTGDLIKDRQKSGISTELDGVQTAALIHRSEALIVNLRQQLQLELNNLANLMGDTPQDELLAVLGEMPIPNLPPLPDAGVPADLLRRRPDVQRDEQAVAEATALIGVAIADLFPQLTLLGNIGLSAKSVSQLFQTDSLIFSVGPSITWNILHFGRIQANIEIQESRARQAYIRYQQTALQAAREVEDTMTQQRAFHQQWLIYQSTVEEDRKAVELALDRYKIGKTNFQRVLDAQQQLLQDQQLLVVAQAGAIEQLVRMYQALGGGWQQRECEYSAPMVAVPQVTDLPDSLEMSEPTMRDVPSPSSATLPTIEPEEPRVVRFEAIPHS